MILSKMKITTDIFERLHEAQRQLKQGKHLPEEIKVALRKNIEELKALQSTIEGK